MPVPGLCQKGLQGPEMLGNQGARMGAPAGVPPIPGGKSPQRLPEAGPGSSGARGSQRQPRPLAGLLRASVAGTSELGALTPKAPSTPQRRHLATGGVIEIYVLSGFRRRPSPYPEKLEHVAVAVLLGIKSPRVIQAFLGS